MSWNPSWVLPNLSLCVQTQTCPSATPACTVFSMWWTAQWVRADGPLCTKLQVALLRLLGSVHRSCSLCVAFSVVLKAQPCLHPCSPPPPSSLTLTPHGSSPPLCSFFFPLFFPPSPPLSHAPQCTPDNLFLPSDILNSVSSRFFFPELEFLTSLLISPPPPPSGSWMIFALLSPSPAPHTTAIGEGRAGQGLQRCLPGAPASS